MKFWFGVLLVTLLFSGGRAAAEPWRDLRVAQGQPDRHERGAQRQRETGRDERPDRRERQQRLSESERRDLHRDLDKARREIYKPRRDR